MDCAILRARHSMIVLIKILVGVYGGRGYGGENKAGGGGLWVQGVWLGGGWGIPSFGRSQGPQASMGRPPLACQWARKV